MIYQTGSFAYQQANWNSNMATWIHQYDNRISLVDGVISFDGIFSLSISSSVNPAISLIYSDSTSVSLSGMGYWASSGTCSVTLVISDTIFCLMGARSGYESNGTFTIGWVKTTANNDFVGVYGGQSSSYRDIEPVSFCDAVDSSRSAFSFGFAANYTLATPKIAYFNKIPLYHSGGDIELIDNAMSCSIVPKGATVTIAGVNYYALGTRTLIPASS